jgi:cytoskeletal protein RodZ
MKTIGQILKSARERKRYSLKKLEELTRIKKDFIEAIEQELWENLPPFPTILGFVKSISTTLDVDSAMAVAVLKRDYPPKNEVISPKPDISSKFVWSPKLTFGIGVGIAAAVILGYLFFQYSKFVSPPSLSVSSPKDLEVVDKDFVLVEGRSDSDAKVIANNQPLITDQDGKFSVELAVTTETKEIVIKAISRSGKETVVSRKIEVK